jgi:biopolymer transport protein ExbD
MTSATDAPAMPRRRAGVRGMKKHSLKTDMTPMVDLGFLLITFFVITTRLSEPQALRLNMPHDGDGTTVGMSNALTILLSEDNAVYYYHGDWKGAVNKNEIFKTSFDLKTGLGKIIREKQLLLDKKNIDGEGRNDLVVMIKANDRANYANVINTLDEMLINVVKRYAIIDPTTEELAWLNSLNNR